MSLVGWVRRMSHGAAKIFDLNSNLQSSLVPKLPFFLSAWQITIKRPPRIKIQNSVTFLRLDDAILVGSSYIIIGTYVTYDTTIYQSRKMQYSHNKVLK